MKEAIVKLKNSRFDNVFTQLPKDVEYPLDVPEIWY